MYWWYLTCVFRGEGTACPPDYIENGKCKFYYKDIERGEIKISEKK